MVRLGMVRGSFDFDTYVRGPYLADTEDRE
ncbi:MAG: hypothetical protein ACI8QC_001338 [Planctomycetota bacterium]